MEQKDHNTETLSENLNYIKAKDRVEKLKRFYNHLAVYFIINTVITGFKVSSYLGSWDAFINRIITIDVLSSWAVWGVVLLMHLISVTLLQGWEARKIEALMRKEMSNKTKQ